MKEKASSLLYSEGRSLPLRDCIVHSVGAENAEDAPNTKAPNRSTRAKIMLVGVQGLENI